MAIQADNSIAAYLGYLSTISYYLRRYVGTIKVLLSMYFILHTFATITKSYVSQENMRVEEAATM